MTQQVVNIGAAANDGTGDTLRVAFAKLNANCTELYAAAIPSAADLLATIKTVDGIGSGLDADLLDGLSSAAFAAAAHTHAIADVTGLQTALDGKGDLSSNASVSVDSELAIFSGTTGKLVKRATGNGLALLTAGVLSLVDPATYALASHAHAIADVTGLQAALDAKLDSASYTAADVLAKLLTVDGSGSGLDADLLDGMSSAAFAAASHTHAQSEVTGLVAALAAKLDASSYTAADVLSKLLTVDGAASGLDADLLDGISSAGFLQTSTYQALTPSWSANHLWLDNVELQIGTGADMRLYHDGTDSWLRNTTGRLIVSGTLAGSSTLPTGLESALDFVVFGSPNVFLRGNSTAGPNMDLLYYRNSFSSPTAPASGNVLGQYRFRGYDTTAPRTSVALQGVCAETWTAGSAYGSNFQLQTIAISATALATRMLVGATATGGFIQGPDGLVGAPGWSFLTDPDCGLYRIAANQIGIATNGTLVLDIATGLFAITATTVRFNTTTATTIGAAGGAAALPATPLGYLSVNVGGTAAKIPYYNT